MFETPVFVQRILSRFLSGAVVLAALTSLGLFDPARAEQDPLPAYAIAQFGQPPESPTSALSPDVRTAIQVGLVDSLRNTKWGPAQAEALQTITASKDPRLAWVISDVIRFVAWAELNAVLTEAAAELLQIKPPRSNSWGVITDHLIAWDIPAPPGYLEFKSGIFTAMAPEWQPLFVEGGD